MAVETADVNYADSLGSKSKKRARDELNEIESDRACAVQTFRQWVLEQRDWLKSPTDFEFLLRFLRVRKFSQVGARMSLENFLTSQTQAPDLFTNVDPTDTTLHEILRKGIISSPMKLDKENRRVVIERLGTLDSASIKEYGIQNVFKCICLVINWLVRDENVQVNGIQVFIDWSGITLQTATTIYTMDNTKKMLHYYQNALPVRMKGLNMYNEPPFFDAIFAILSPFLKEKSKRRMTLHGKTMTSVYEKIDKSVLPTEYLPDDYSGQSAGSLKKIVDDMIADMQKPDFVRHMKDLTDPDKHGVDLSLKPKDEKSVGTYRKLQVD